MTSYDDKSGRRWRIGGTVAAVVVTMTAGGLAWANEFGPASGHDTAVRAADPTPTPSPDGKPPHRKADPREKGPRAGKFGHPGFGAALHGEFVIKQQDGKYQTVATQHGTVTEASKDSVTVKSEDGFSRTYTLTEDTLVDAARDGIDDVKKGDTVRVFATVADGKATAVSLNDSSVRKAAREKWKGPR